MQLNKPWPRKKDFRKPGKRPSYLFATQHVWDKFLGSQNLKATFSPFAVDQHRVMRKFWTLEAFTELPLCASSFKFCTFFFFDWEKSWLDMFTFCTFLSISLFLSPNFFFVHPASHKRLCLQSLDLDERKVGWTCLYFALFQSWFDMFIFCTFLREKLMENFYILREKLIGRVYILLFFEREKLMGNFYISREKMIGHV